VTSFVLQLVAFFQQGYVQLFLVFFLFTQLFWWLRVYIAGKNRTYTDKYKGSYAVFVAVYQEDPDLFERCLKSITTHGKPLELIVTIDDAPNASKRIKQIASQYATRVIEVARRVGKREQYALASEILRKKPDVIITVDSDTVWDETTLNILKPFTNEKVGAVTGRQVITKADSNWIRRIAEWFEDLRFRVTLPFQSYYGQVNVIPGRTLAARAEAYKSAAQAARTETFAGRRMITSDDASVTMHILRQGFSVVYQDDSTVTTEAPDTLRGFVRQYVRWYRGSFRRFFRYLGQIVRMHPLIVLSNIEFLFFSFIFTAIMLTFVFKIVFRVYEFDPISLAPGLMAWIIPLIILGFLVSAVIRNIPHLSHKPRDFVFTPVFAVFSLVVLLFVKFVAVFSFSENGWLTRVKGSYGEGKVGRARVIAAITGLVILGVTLPLPYLTDVQPLGVPFNVLAKGEGPEYYRAHQLADNLNDGNNANDPTAEQVTALLRANGFNLGYRTNDDIAPLAVPCATEKLKSFDHSQGDLVLKQIDTCYQKIAADPKLVEEKKAEQKQQEPQKIADEKPAPATQPSLPKTITSTAKSGDTLTYLIRDQVKKNASSLSAAQAVFVETTYLAQTNQQDRWLNPGETVTLDGVKLDELINQARGLSASQLAAWGTYANNIVW